MKLEPNNIYQGDCLELMQGLNDKSVDLFLCDPPHNKTACKWDNIIHLEQMWSEILRVKKPSTPIVIIATQPYTSTLILSNEKMFKYCWVWEKNKATGFLNAKIRPMPKTEDIVVFYSSQCKYYPQKSVGHNPVNSYTKNTSDGETLGKTLAGFSGGGQTDRYPTNVINIPVVNNDNSDGEKYYPTQKPVKLMEYFIKTYTDKNDLVLDFAMGSGTTCVAAKMLGRRYIGIDLLQKAYSIAQQRLDGVNLDLFQQENKQEIKIEQTNLIDKE